MNSGTHVSETPSALSPSGHRGPSSRGDDQDTPWINALSAVVVSRPALSLLHKYLPGLFSIYHHTRSSLTDRVVPECVSGDLQTTLSGREVSFLGDMMTTTTTSLAEDVCRLTQPRSESNPKWLTAESLSELGVKHVRSDIEKKPPPVVGDFSSVRNLGHVLLNSSSSSSTEATSSLLQGDCRSPTWCSGLWGREEVSQSLLSKLSLGSEEFSQSRLSQLSMVKGQGAAHCSPPPGGTKAAVAQTTALFVQFSSWESMSCEHAGHSSDTRRPVDNGRVGRPQPESPKCSDGRALQHEPTSIGTTISAEAGTVFNGVAVLTPDQDNGYSSLEEGHALCQPHMVKVIAEEELLVAGDIPTGEMETSTSEPIEEPSPAAEGMEEEGAEGDMCGGGGEITTQEGSSAAASMLTPYCQNRAIAFIMGSPCSEDEEEEEEEDDDDDDDDSDSLSDSELSDDGFDSECSSEVSDSDEEVDSETERLLNSLCPTQDPYNPRNFTAPTNTGPRPIPSTSAAAARSSDSSPDSSPVQGSASPVSLSVSPPGLQHPDSWDDSTSASEAEDASELLNLFSSSSDPYSLWNFKAPVWTQRPLAEVQKKEKEEEEEEGKKSLKMPPSSPPQVAAAAAASSAPRYLREEADDRLDSGFSEPPAPVAADLTSVTSRSCVVLKKVRFCEEVEEFFTSSREDEDRRGQWEELGRDRCRFSRRCHEVEQSIAYCLEPQHRTLAYSRLTLDPPHGELAGGFLDST